MKGWECPKCGKVWAPFIYCCEECNNKVKNTKEVDYKTYFAGYGGFLSANLLPQGKVKLIPKVF